MAQREDDSRQQQQGSTGQRSEGHGGGHRQADQPDHVGQQRGKAGLADGSQPRQEGTERQAGADERSGGEQQRQQQERREDLGGPAGDPDSGARVTQGNLGTTQREWNNRDNLADSDEV